MREDFPAKIEKQNSGAFPGASSGCGFLSGEGSGDTGAMQAGGIQAQGLQDRGALPQPRGAVRQGIGPGKGRRVNCAQNNSW